MFPTTLSRCLLGPASLVGLFEVLSSSRKMKGAALAAPDRHGEIKEPRLVIVMIVIITKLPTTPRLQSPGQNKMFVLAQPNSANINQKSSKLNFSISASDSLHYSTHYNFER